MKIFLENNSAYQKRWTSDNQDSGVEETVKTILKNVKKSGLKAVLQYSKKFDGFNGTETQLLVKNKTIKSKAQKVDKNLLKALKLSANNIKKVAKLDAIQKSKKTTLQHGVEIVEKTIPVNSVCIYVPGGRFPLISSLLMGVITAQVAGVKNIFVCTPTINSEICAAAEILGITEIYKLGGAQAIGAFAYGAKGQKISIPKVDMICGPGNAFVATAKSIVSQQGTGIDMVAGPTEYIAIISNNFHQKNKRILTYIAHDIIAQAEHGPDSKVAVLTDSISLANELQAEINNILPNYLNSKQAITDYGFIKATKNIDSAIELCNQLAPEHVWVENKTIANKINNAGTILVGKYANAGNSDYVDGPNHVLPTNGYANIRGGLCVRDFTKTISQHIISKEGLKNLGESGYIIGNAEGLVGHADSIKVRLDDNME